MAVSNRLFETGVYDSKLALGTPQSTFEIFVRLLGYIEGIPAMIANAETPLGRSIMYASNMAAKGRIPDFGDLLQSHFYGKISEADFRQYMAYFGFEGQAINQLIYARERYLTPMDYATLYRRGKINRDKFNQYCRACQLPASEIRNLLNATEYFPSPPDLIRFAIREVYTPAIAEKFGQFEDVSEQFLNEAAKAGLPREQALNYWAAHWELPSLTQAYEMFQRTTDNPIDPDADEIRLPSGAITHNVIGKKTLQMLMRAQDVMPFWRDKLEQISYVPLTRVDVRRMYRVGVADEDQVYRNYRDIGYSPDNAALMTEFTKKYENEENVGISRASVVDAYKDGLLTQDELIGYLKQLGYTDSVIAFWVTSAQYDFALARMKLVSQDIIDRYIMGDIDLQQLQAELLQLDIPAIFLQKIVDDLTLAQGKKRKIPTKDELESWLKVGAIDEQFYFRRMRQLGYRDDDIHIYLSVYAEGLNTDKRKFLPVTTYQRWLKKEIMTEKQFVDTLNLAGYGQMEIQGLLAETREPQNVSKG